MKCIINFDFPATTSDYLHRVGRCGRAGQQGWVYSLYREKDSALIKELSHKEIPIKGSSYAKINKEILKSQAKMKA